MTSEAREDRRTLLSPSDDTRSAVNASFRDPAGRVVVAGKRAFRVINNSYRSNVEKILNTDFYRELVSTGQLIDTFALTDSALIAELSSFADRQTAAPLIVEHEHISFPSYPYEWPPEMLLAAGELTLQLAEKLLPHGFGLKDASPYNILFRGARPVFVDLLSIEQREPADPTWLAYAQFIRTFIRPLLVDKYFGIGLDQTFHVYRDGLYPQQAFQMAGFVQKVKPLFLTSVTLPAMLSRLHPARYQKIYKKRYARSAEQAQFILSRQLKGLRRKLRSVEPNPQRKSAWANYEDDTHSERYFAVKSEFVQSAIEERRPRNVLDIGCNRGHFSLLAAKSGCSVVSIDRDPVVVGSLWRRASHDNLDILPLVVDLTRPSAGLGWRNQESRSFLDRANGAFDCAIVLAVIHHMLVTERIPLHDILKLLSELTTDLLIIEFIAPEDPLFTFLTRGNEDLYTYLTRDYFEAALRQFFVVETSARIPDSHRWLYKARRAGFADKA